MTGPTCPAEGCDYNENGEKSKQSVRRHINAKTDDAHSDTEALRSALNRPAEGDEKGAEQGDQGAPDDTEDDEQGEAAQERPEADENSETEHQEMDQSSEYEQQVARNTGEESTDEGTETEGQQGNKTSQTTSGRGVPVGAIVAGLLLLGVLAVALSGSNDQPTEVDSEVVEDTDADPVADDPEADVQW
ncbi:hypothetical protein [Haloarcula sebkhae]|uniref:Uncharacterized protein n=2 Tax=Haloarcula sebkhae TaxID=932660 RepID=A0A830EJG4_9EURY|nr:hypothetical protein [Haloarcula sebkhae]GGK63590.1 hypothetical protein GCM10009067_14940 [Haloarcula sebkhae]